MRGVIGNSTIGCFLHITHIASISIETRSTVCEYLLVCRLSGLGSDGARVKLTVKFYLDAVYTAGILHIVLILTIIMLGILHIIIIAYLDFLVVNHTAPIIVGSLGTGCRHVVSADKITAGIVGERIVAAV